jgi:hypothetical protein
MVTSLECLDISNSFFVGEIPSQLGMLSNLKSFIAAGNDFHGKLPIEVGLLKSLEELGKFFQDKCSKSTKHINST